MKRSTRIIPALFLGVVLAACGDSTSAGSGKLTVQLTDAPFPFSDVARVDVWVTRIDAKQATTDSAESAQSNDRSGWVTVATPNASFNLLDLQGGKTANLGTATLASGSYRGFRMILDTDKSTITLKSGAKVDVKWPSAGQTGIKINLAEPIQVSDSAVMVVDFDVGRSFVMRGSSIAANGLLFKPVLQAVAKSVTQSVSGSVRADNATGAQIAVASVEVLAAGTALGDTASANVRKTTSTDASGNFNLGYVAPGAYALRVTPPAASGYKPALHPAGLTVTLGANVTGITVIVTK